MAPDDIRPIDLEFDASLSSAERQAVYVKAETRARTRGLKDAWRAWAARYDWDWFVTLTWSPNRTRDLYHVRGDVGKWGNDLSRREWGRRYYDRDEGLFGFVIPEEHADGRWHVHALVGGVGNLSTAAAEYLWERRWGRARVEEYVDARGLDYVFKLAVWVGDPFVLGTPRDD